MPPPLPFGQHCLKESNISVCKKRQFLALAKKKIKKKNQNKKRVLRRLISDTYFQPKNISRCTQLLLKNSIYHFMT